MNAKGAKNGWMKIVKQEPSGSWYWLGVYVFLKLKKLIILSVIYQKLFHILESVTFFVLNNLIYTTIVNALRVSFREICFRETSYKDWRWSARFSECQFKWSCSKYNRVGDQNNPNGEQANLFQILLLYFRQKFSKSSLLKIYAIP
jgi:hypothetical protein